VNQQKLPAQTYVQSKPQFEQQPQNNNNSSASGQSASSSPEKKSILKKQSAYENKPPQPVPSEPQVIRAQPEVIRQSASPQKQQQSQNEPPARGMPRQSDLENDQDQLAGVSIAKTASMFGERTRTKIPSASNAAPKREMTPPRSLSPPRESTPPREKSPEPAARAAPPAQIPKAPSPEPEIKEEIKSPTPASNDFESVSDSASDGNPEYFSENEEIAQIIAPTNHSPVKAAPVVLQRQPSPSPESSKDVTPVPYADIEEPKKMKALENKNPPLAFGSDDNSDITDPEMQQEDDFDLLGDTIKEQASAHVPKPKPEDYLDSSDESVDIDGTTVPVSRIDENENISMQRCGNFYKFGRRSLVRNSPRVDYRSIFSRDNFLFSLSKFCSSSSVFFHIQTKRREYLLYTLVSPWMTLPK